MAKLKACAISKPSNRADRKARAFLSARLEGLDIAQALSFANKVSSQIVASKGVHLTKEQQEALRTELKQK